MTLEAILILIIFVSVNLTFARWAREQNFAYAFAQGPWPFVQGMIEDGVWRRVGEQSKAANPQVIQRKRAWEGIPVE